MGDRPGGPSTGSWGLWCEPLLGAVPTGEGLGLAFFPHQPQAELHGPSGFPRHPQAGPREEGYFWNRRGGGHHERMVGPVWTPTILAVGSRPVRRGPGTLQLGCGLCGAAVKHILEKNLLWKRFRLQD